MMIWRVKFKMMGSHVHCDLYVAEEENATFAKCGEFRVREGDEFLSLVSAFRGARFIPYGRENLQLTVIHKDVQ